MKSCITCELLGVCHAATFDMVKNDLGCGSWKKAIQELINARRKAIELAGSSAIREMLKTPPKQLTQ